jgi:hypothetical protein
MNTAPITAAPSDMSGLPPPIPPSAPGAPGAPSFSDMLASATSSLAAFALLPTSASDALSSAGNPPPAPKKDPNTDNAAVPIALPAPVQSPPATANDASTGSSTAAPTQPASAAAGAQQNQQSASTATGAPSGSAGTGGTSSGSAQATNGTALPAMAAELNTKIALGAQALLSQPSQVLATLPHGALPTAAALVQNAAAHGAAAPDPAAVLPKLAASATVAAATPQNPAPALDAALQSAAVQTSSTTAEAEATALATASDPTAQSSTDTTAGIAPAPTAVPVPVTDAAPSLETAPPPTVASSALDQVAASLTQGSKLGLSQIEIQLKPASLGAVDVKLELTHDGRVAAVISADRSDTLMQLQRGSGELQQALKDAGLQTDSGSLSFNLRGDAQTSDQSGRQPSYAAPQSAMSGSASDDALAIPVPLAGASQSAYSGLLNIQV